MIADDGGRHTNPERERVLTDQVVVRVTPEMRSLLEADAEKNGRTVAQSIRWHLERYLAAQQGPPATDEHGFVPSARWDGSRWVPLTMPSTGGNAEAWTWPQNDAVLYQGNDAIPEGNR